jgi:hypothetical protein
MWSILCATFVGTAAIMMASWHEAKPMYQRPANDNEPGVLVALEGHPAPPVVIEVEETFVSVTFCQTARRYLFGRLTDSGDLSRFGPLCRRQHADQVGKDDSPDDPLESLAYTFALRAVAN